MTNKEFCDKYEKSPVEHYPHNVKDNPVVSIGVHTYQHAKYIGQCLDSILMQKTNFPFEILIGDDASTDGTREICKEYAERYPEKIRLFLHNRNNNISIAGSPSGRFNFVYNLISAKGEYFSICEGDDYWISDTKLQLQYDTLIKSKPKVIWSAHDAVILKNKSFLKRPFMKIKKNKFSMYDTIKFGGGLLPSASLFFKNVFTIELPYFMDQVISGDLVLLNHLASKSEGIYIDKPLSVYRLHEGGIFSSKNSDLKFRNTADLNKIRYYIGLFRRLPYHYWPTLFLTILKLYFKVLKRVLKKFFYDKIKSNN